MNLINLSILKKLINALSFSRWPISFQSSFNNYFGEKSEVMVGDLSNI